MAMAMAMLHSHQCVKLLPSKVSFFAQPFLFSPVVLNVDAPASSPQLASPEMRKKKLDLFLTALGFAF